MAKAPHTKAIKTNAMRVLDAQKIPYAVHLYDPAIHAAEDVAAVLGVPATHVFKTLVVLPESGQGRPLLVLVPSTGELDLKGLGQQPGVGEKRLRMASQREAESLTGLLVGGISPLALLQKGFRIFIDASAGALAQLYLSGGQRGVNLQVAAADLIRVIGATPVATQPGADEDPG